MVDSRKPDVVVSGRNTRKGEADELRRWVGEELSEGESVHLSFGSTGVLEQNLTLPTR